MAREILFKAKRIDKHEGEWVEGYVSRPHSKDTEKGIVSYYFNAIDEMGWTYECIVSAETVCQYTGLTDHYNNKIWENDIVEHEEDIYLVSWSEMDACFELYNAGLLERFTSILGEDCEVMGNKFDNPEWFQTLD